MREIVQLAEDRALYRMQVQMAAEADNHAWNVANEAFFKSNPDYWRRRTRSGSRCCKRWSMPPTKTPASRRAATSTS